MVSTLLHRARRRAGRARRRLRRAVRRRPELSIVAADPAAVPPRRGVEVVADVAAARGDYVTVLDAGDRLTSDFVGAVLDAVRPDRVVFAPVVRTGEQPPRRKADRAGLTEALRTVRGAVVPARFAGTIPAERGLAETAWLAQFLTATRVRAVLVPVGYVSDTEPPVESHTAALDLIDHLDTLPRTHPQPVVAAAIGAATAPVNHAVRADPSLRAEVLRRVEHIADFDYGRLNHGLGRDLAVLYAAVPLADTSANIAARRVRDFGAIVDVISADLRRKRATDASAEPLWQQWLDTRVQVGGRGTVQGDWAAIGRFVRDGLEFVARQEATKGAYRSVYSRTMFPAAHLLAAAYKLEHPETPWVAEFSDPQLLNPYGERRRSTAEPDAELLRRLGAALVERGVTPPAETNVWEWAETATYALADTVLFTNDHQRDYMLGYSADPVAAARAAERAVVSHHPSPPPELYAAADPDYPLEPGRVHVGYFGTFYPTRTLTEVVDAIGTLAAPVRARVRLHVFTTKPDALRDDVAAAGLGDVVVVGPYLPFTSYLAMTTRFDVLVVNDYRTTSGSNPYLPAKYADYRGSGTPVWGVVEPGSVLSGLPLQYRSELGDVAGAAQVLAELITGRSGAMP